MLPQFISAQNELWEILTGRHPIETGSLDPLAGTSNPLSSGGGPNVGHPSMDTRW